MPSLPPHGPPPTVPHIVCKDGFYWALGRTRRGPFPCKTAELRTRTVVEVAATYEGDAQSRAQALAELTEGERLLLYPQSCICGQNHLTNVANLVRAWQSIDAGVRPACGALATQSYIKIAAVRGDTPEDTARAQALAASSAALRAVPPSDRQGAAR